MYKTYSMLFFLTLQVPPSHAGTLNQALDDLCAKTQHCAEEHAKKPSDIEDVMKQVMASMCDGLEEPYQVSETDPKLYAAATRCVKSRASQSCKKLDKKTRACAVYEKLLDEFKH